MPRIRQSIGAEALAKAPDLSIRTQESLDAVDLLVNRGYLSDLPSCEPIPMVEPDNPYETMALFRIAKVVYLKGEDVNEKLVSVYGALSSIGSSALILVRGSSSGIEFYIGTRDENYDRRLAAEGVLESSLRGNFPGIEMTSCSEKQVGSLMESAFPRTYAHKSMTCVTILPSERISAGTHEGSDDKFVQGIEKFIEGMEGQSFTALFLATPVATAQLAKIRRTYEDISTSLSVLSQVQRQVSEQESISVADGVNDSFSQSVSTGFSETAGSHTDTSRAKTRNRDRHHNSQVMFVGGTAGTSRGITTSKSSGVNESKTTTTNDTNQSSHGTSHTDTATSGSSKAVTLTQTDKTVESLIKRIDTQLERIGSCESYGIWEVGCYFVSDHPQISVMAAATFKALVSGERTQLERAYVNTWSSDRASFTKVSEVFGSLRLGKQPTFSYEIDVDRRPTYQVVAPIAFVSGKELPLVLGLPRHSVSGVTAISSAEFGRNVLRGNGKLPLRFIDLGVVSYMGRTEAGIPVHLDTDALTAHCFVTGSTGSGKSNTTYQLLNELVDKRNDVKFLVIEPAKGEYKLKYGRLPGINVFTTNSLYNEMLRINPFAFPDEVHVLEHLDRVIEVFSACWPLYAAMPALLKKAFERAYVLHGWDLSNSYRINLGNGPWPSFGEICSILPKMLESSDFSGDTKGDYIGSLVTRVESLTNGLVGELFSGESIAPEVIFDENTIVDLSRIGSTETKALIMGILILQLNEYRQSKSVTTNAGLRHVTVLEEAHNLLRRTSTDQSQEGANVQGKSVEMISNSIAEMRTYGEGFIIVDQSPSAVDVSAIRNTNTKIVMRLPELEDRTAAGASVGLSEEQIAEIAKLPMGHAVVYQNDWLEPVLTRVARAESLYERSGPKLNAKETHAQLIGMVIEELYKQHDAQAMEQSPIDVIVRTSPDTASNKRIIRQLVTSLVRACVDGIDEYEFGLTVANLVRIDDLLDVLAVKLPATDRSKTVSIADKRAFAQWKSLAKGNLDYYVKLSSDRLKESVLKNQIAYVTTTRRIASWEKYECIWNTFYA